MWKGKEEALADALQGIMQPHQRFMISRQLAHIDHLEELIADVSQEIAKRVDPFEETKQRRVTDAISSH